MNESWLGFHTLDVETANKQIEELKEEINKYQKNVVRLETELEDLKK